jgi:hypothetical protein
MTLKNFTLTIAALAALFVPVSAEAQVTLTTTTLSNQVGAAAGVSGVSCFVVASATGIVAPSFGSPNVPTGNQTELFVDREAMLVYSLSGTYVCALRGYATTTAKAHNSGATVYIGSPANFSNNEQAGYCLSTTIQETPVINVTTGDIFKCSTTGNQWFKIAHGTQTGTPQTLFTAFCSGTVGSAETETLNDTTCSGGTTKSLIFTVPYAGTLANFYASSTANFLGTGGSTFTVLLNAVATTIVCAPTAATKACSDTTHSVTVKAGDLVNVTFLSATSDTAANVNVSVGLY